MQIENIPAGESWACRYRCTRWLDTNGSPISAAPSVGSAHPGTPGEWEGIGVIQIRDADRRLVQLWDTELQSSVTVSWDQIWAVEPVEWLDDVQETA